MGTRRVPLGVPRVAAVVLVLGLAATTPYIYFATLQRPVHDALAAIRAATAAHDAPLELVPTQRDDMGTRPDCW